MKKSTLLMIVSIVLALTLSLGSTLAYLQDSDSDVNVMTLGSVYIEQHEQERGENGDLQDYPEYPVTKPLYPAIGTLTTDGTVEVGGESYEMWDNNNVLDKIVTVENTGKSGAYVRTIFAVEDYVTDSNNANLELNWNKQGDWTEADKVLDGVQIEGATYDIYVVYYTDILEKETTTAPSLLQVALKSEAGNEDVAAYGDELNILVLSQAVQTEGFETAEEALTEGFGHVNEANVKSWFEGTVPPIDTVDISWYDDAETEFTLSTAAELAGLSQLVSEGKTFSNKTVMLDSDINLYGMEWTPIGKASGQNYGFHGTFDGKNHTVSNFTVNNSEYAGLFGNVYTGEVKNLTVTDANITTNHYAGVIAGASYAKITNCHVKDSTIVCLPENTSNGWDNGDKAGAIIGYLAEGDTLGVTDCSVENVTITAYRDMGAVVGYTYSDVTNNTVKNVTLIKDDTNDYKLTADDNTVNAYVGTVNDKYNPTVENNTGADTVSITKGIVIDTVEELENLAQAVNSGTTYKGKTIVLTADIDLKNKEWTPIGNKTNNFQGTFDGNGHTISNLKITGNKDDVGLFGYTTVGEIKNLTVHNASVSGYLDVGVVAGSPYTSKYTNIKVTGDVKVDGYAYVGAVGGKNAYANWTNITVDVSDSSYVKANSENYRTYVGGVIGFMGEGGHTVSNVTSNIDVYGSTCDVGGIVGIAHYGNTFTNVTCNGNVYVDADDETEIGGISGVWHNGGADVTMNDCVFNGKLYRNNVEYNPDGNARLAGTAYFATGTGNLNIN